MPFASVWRNYSGFLFHWISSLGWIFYIYLPKYMTTGNHIEWSIKRHSQKENFESSYAFTIFNEPDILESN